jgi:hypothetical protein
VPPQLFNLAIHAGPYEIAWTNTGGWLKVKRRVQIGPLVGQGIQYLHDLEKVEYSLQ